MKNLVSEIQTILDKKLPSQVTGKALISKSYFGGEFIAIHIYMGGGQTINNCKGQYPNHISLSLGMCEAMELKFQVFGGSGGRGVERNIDPSIAREKYNAMSHENISFRTPKPTKEAVLESLEGVCDKYLAMLQDFKNRGLLRHTKGGWGVSALDYSFLK